MQRESTSPSAQEPVPTRPHDALSRYVLVLLAIMATTTVLYVGQGLFILFFVAGIFSFLLLPLCQRMERWGFPTGLAAALSCLLLLLIFFGTLFFLGWQYSHFGKDLPELKDALLQHLADGQAWFERKFNVTQSEQTAWFNKELSALAESGSGMAMSFFSATGAAVANAIIIPILTFFLLLMKSRFRVFFSRLRSNHDGTVLRVVENIARLSRQWLKGVLTVVLFMAVMDSIGFLALGLKYAILMGVTAALLNVIPYIGPWMGAVLPLLIALLTKDSAMYALGVVGVIAITQFLDNNFITPKIVGSSVALNPLASIIALIGWGLLWGLMGLILAIPITGMLKLVFDEIPTLKPWGYLLGEERKWPRRRKRKPATVAVGTDAPAKQ